MIDSEIVEFQTLLTDVMAFYGKDVSPFALEVWWSACRQFEMSRVRRALTRHAMDADRGQFAPKPADVVRQLQGTTTDKAALAWGKAIDAAGRVGAYADVVFDDPAIHAAIVDLGGWPKFCRVETKDLSYQQHRFQQSYAAYADREAFDHPSILYGDRSPDDVYAKRGLPPPQPVMIGRTDVCQRLLSGAKPTGNRINALALEAVS